MAMKTSPAGRAALTQREGCRLTAYRDTVGVWTIGVGHASTAPTPPLVAPGMTITAQAADEILSRDLAVFEKAVNAADPKGRLSQNAFDASVSLAFNIGIGAFAKSTVARLIASGELAGAADAFLMWVKPPELKGRRQSERAQFLKPDAAPQIVHVDTDKPVLASIETAINKAGAGMVAPAAQPVAGPHLLPKPAPRTGLAGLWDRMTGKA
ncbi:MAG: lysozyme [Janthinobacterium lividum]